MWKAHPTRHRAILAVGPTGTPAARPPVRVPAGRSHTASNPEYWGAAPILPRAELDCSQPQARTRGLPCILTLVGSSRSYLLAPPF